MQEQPGTMSRRLRIVEKENERQRERERARESQSQSQSQSQSPQAMPPVQHCPPLGPVGRSVKSPLKESDKNAEAEPADQDRPWFSVYSSDHRLNKTG